MLVLAVPVPSVGPIRDDHCSTRLSPVQWEREIRNDGASLRTGGFRSATHAGSVPLLVKPFMLVCMTDFFEKKNIVL